MKTDLAIRCFCGSMQGTVRDVCPEQANRVACYCRYCEAYAHELGRASEVLDEWGGTERFQVSPAALQIARGLEHLACMQLTPKGALRWYASCCSTPIAVTLRSSNVPFLALDRCCVEERGLLLPLDAIVGPLRARANGRFSKAQAGPMVASFGALLRMLFHLVPLLVKWWWLGDQRRWAFFDAQTGRARVSPKLVATSALQEVVARRATERLELDGTQPARGCG